MSIEVLKAENADLKVALILTHTDIKLCEAIIASKERVENILRNRIIKLEEDLQTVMDKCQAIGNGEF